MARYLPVSEAKAKLSEIVRHSDSEDVVLTHRGPAAAVVMSVDRHATLMEQFDDLEDRLSTYEASGVTVPFAQVVAELGLDS